MTTWRQQARENGWAPPRSKPAPRVVETPEYVQMVRRMLTRLGERAGDDPTALPALVEMRDVITLALVAAVSAARSQAEPYSWAEIGRELGVSRQAAQQWYERQTSGSNLSDGVGQAQADLGRQIMTALNTQLRREGKPTLGRA